MEFHALSAQEQLDVVIDLKTKLVEAQQQRDEYKKDAMRYRWLRSSQKCGRVVFDENLSFRPAGETLDAAIDAAISEQEQCEPVAVTLGEPISDPTEDEQYWLDSIHSRIPLTEGTLLYTHPAPVPAGWQLVPVEPTDAILAVMYSCESEVAEMTAVEAYKAMLQAAPKGEMK